MKKIIGPIIMVLFFFFPGLLSATDVGGIINSNTVWGLTGSPYTMTSEVQIADGVTLTIQPGVVVGRSITSSRIIRVWGTLNAVGTAALNITFNEVWIVIGDNATNGVVNIQFANFISGNFAFSGPPGLGNSTLTLLDSKLNNASITYFNPTGDCHIERNTFVNTKSNSFGAVWPNVNVYIRNNIFSQWTDNSAVGLANYSGMSNSKIIFKCNTFLDTDKIALEEIPLTNISTPGHTFNPEMIVANNYWGTTNTSVIDSMIYDRNDDLNYYTYFTYKPFLLADPRDSDDDCISDGEGDAGANLPTSDSGGGGGCFIATAAYGSLMEPHVKILRDFRDRFLLDNKIGKGFVCLYYSYSPPIAQFIAKHDSMRAMVRISLLPVVGISWVTLKIGPLSTMALMLIFISCFVALVWSRQRYKE